MVKTKQELRKEYFALRDDLYNRETGFTRAEIHDLLKRNIFPMLVDEEDNWSLEQWNEQHIVTCTTLSLNWLSEKGLQIFIEQCKSFINDHF